jgi:hypothetical protein
MREICAVTLWGGRNPKLDHPMKKPSGSGVFGNQTVHFNVSLIFLPTLRLNFSSLTWAKRPACLVRQLNVDDNIQHESLSSTSTSNVPEPDLYRHLGIDFWRRWCIGIIPELKSKSIRIDCWLAPSQCLFQDASCAIDDGQYLHLKHQKIFRVYWYKLCLHVYCYSGLMELNLSSIVLQGSDSRMLSYEPFMERECERACICPVGSVSSQNPASVVTFPSTDLMISRQACLFWLHFIYTVYIIAACFQL